MTACDTALEAFGVMPASDVELAKYPLPVDVQVGSVIFRKGVPLLQLVGAMRCYQQRALSAGSLAL